ncbi:MAG: hypothetical protein HC923_00805 [Myxococcales bacterium]|nr:hypothetical protein [Myxococcales bacterium]
MFSECEAALVSFAGGSAQRAEDLFDEAFGILPWDPEVSVLHVPVEVRPFASAGLEGPHYGAVVPMPEIGETQSPIVRFEDDGRMVVFARSADEMLRRLLETRLEDDEDADVELLRRIAEVLRLPPVAERAPSDLRLPIPLGYRFAPTHDGIGVYAPAARWRQPEDPYREGLTLAEVQKLVDRLTHDGQWGSALVLLKNACYLGRRDASVWRMLGSMWADTYARLGREELAKEVRRRIGRYG